MTELAQTTDLTADQARRLTERIRTAWADLSARSHQLDRLNFVAPARPTRDLYLMQMGDDGPVKVGVAFDAEARRRNLQTANPYPIHLRFVIPGAGDREREIHERLSCFHLSGEWFEPIPEIFDWFCMEAI